MKRASYQNSDIKFVIQLLLIIDPNLSFCLFNKPINYKDSDTINNVEILPIGRYIKYQTINQSIISNNKCKFLEGQNFMSKKKKSCMKHLHSWSYLPSPFPLPWKKMNFPRSVDLLFSRCSDVIIPELQPMLAYVVLVLW